MAAYSTLRPSKAQLAQFTAAYAKHRPLAQRVLNIGFILYIITWSYKGVSGKSTSPQTTRKGKGKEKADGKQRVAVRVLGSLCYAARIEECVSPF